MTFVTSFDPAAGDLVYGRSEVRHVYLTTLPLTDVQRRALRTAWATLDDYNIAFGTAGTAFLHADTPSEGGVLAQLDASHAAIAPDPTTAAGARQQAYYDAIRHGRSRLRVATVFSASRHALRNEGTGLAPRAPTFVQRLFLSREAQRADGDALYAAARYKALRRACKLGIGLVAAAQAFETAKILFVLDGLDMLTVVNKLALPRHQGQAVPVTSSELRYVFRHWNELAGAVQFFVGGHRVAAPWEEDWELDNLPDTHTPSRWGARIRAEKAAWLAYRDRRLDKYGGALPAKTPL